MGDMADDLVDLAMLWETHMEEACDGKGPCPDCGAPTVLRKNKRDDSYFYGCSRYPDCKGTRHFVRDELMTKKTVQAGIDLVKFLETL